MERDQEPVPDRRALADIQRQGEGQGVESPAGGHGIHPIVPVTMGPASISKSRDLLFPCQDEFYRSVLMPVPEFE